MKWLLSIIRIGGSPFPAGAMLNQLQAELDAHDVEQRLQALEDPLASLQPEAGEVSREIYAALGTADAFSPRFDESFFERHAAVLAALDARGFVSGTHTFGGRFGGGIISFSPQYVIYMAYFYEDQDKMQRLIDLISQTPVGRWLKGKEVAKNLALPFATVRAVFRTYASNNLGIMSNELGTANYRRKV